MNSARFLPLSALLLMTACATVEHKVPVGSPALVATAPASIPATMPPVLVPAPASGAVTWTVSDPVGSPLELSRVLTQALDRKATTVSLKWTGTQNSANLSKAFGQAWSVASGASTGGLFVRSYEYEYSTSGATASVKLGLHYAFPDSQAAARIAETEKRAEQVVAQILPPGMGDYEKELALHDWLVNHARYDTANYNANTVPDPEYSPYGVLVLGTGVCESYATAFQLLAGKAGLESRFLAGTADGASHSWNQVKVNSQWYHLDVTWDDPVGAGDSLVHFYFNLTDAQMAKIHNWDNADAMSCLQTDQNWYTREGLVCSNLAEFGKAVQSALAGRQTSVIRRIDQYRSASFNSDIANVLQTAAKAAKRSVRWSYSTEPNLGIVEVTLS